jgi:hypothetical protein
MMVLPPKSTLLYFSTAAISSTRLAIARVISSLRLSGKPMEVRFLKNGREVVWSCPGPGYKHLCPELPDRQRRLCS